MTQTEKKNLTLEQLQTELLRNKVHATDNPGLISLASEIQSLPGIRGCKSNIFTGTVIA